MPKEQPAPANYQVVSLRVENFKRISAVFIEPSGSIVELTGENNVGKTSVIDALWAAIAGKKAAPTKPIKSGSQTAEVHVDLGGLKVTRRFKLLEDGRTGSSLVVSNADGFKAQNPQEILNELIGSLSFDPLAFTMMSAEQQFDAISAFVPNVDFKAIELADRSDYDERTNVNREHKQVLARISAFPAIDVDKVPAARVDEAELVADLEEAGQINASIERGVAARTNMASAIEAKRAESRRLHERAEALRQEAAALDAKVHELNVEAERENATLQALPALETPIETAPIRSKINEARLNNEAFDRAKRAAEDLDRLRKEADRLNTQSEQLTRQMEDREAQKRAAIAAAAMPVKGLSLRGDTVEFEGEPFSQASHAQKIRVSVAIAAAMNPRLRIAFVRDGSLLDRKSWELLAKEAARLNFQIWTETVESGRPSAIELEDGHVKAKASAAETVEQVTRGGPGRA
jgi:hypothetical protein